MSSKIKPKYDNLNVKISNWDDLHRIYESEIPNWDNESSYQTFEGWLRERCHVPKLIKNNK